MPVVSGGDKSATCSPGSESSSALVMCDLSEY